MSADQRIYSVTFFTRWSSELYRDRLTFSEADALADRLNDERDDTVRGLFNVTVPENTCAWCGRKYTRGGVNQDFCGGTCYDAFESSQEQDLRPLGPEGE